MTRRPVDAYQCCRLLVSFSSSAAKLTSGLDNNALAGDQDTLLLGVLNHTLEIISQATPHQPTLAIRSLTLPPADMNSHLPTEKLAAPSEQKATLLTEVALEALGLCDLVEADEGGVAYGLEGVVEDTIPVVLNGGGVGHDAAPAIRVGEMEREVEREQSRCAEMRRRDG